jgi:hypothetical protein
VTEFSSLLEKVLSSVRLLAALARKAELDQYESERHHCLSAEFGDSWLGVTEIVSQVRIVNGDPEDVNYLLRARAIENQLAEAVGNEPKLAIADAKNASLEKVSRLNRSDFGVGSAIISHIHSNNLFKSNYRNFYLGQKKSKCKTAVFQNWRLCWPECRLQLPCLP